MLKILLKSVTISFVVALLYLSLKPNDIDPVKWVAPEMPTMTGMLSPNDELKKIHIASTEDHYGPEDIALDSMGRIYMGTNNGNILRFTPDATHYEIFANTKGRPLGLDFDAEGNLIVADSDNGLLLVDKSGNVKVLSTTEGGKPFKFTDDVEVANDGKIYFTDASFKVGIQDYKLDLIEHRPNGRLLCYDPATQTTSLLMDSLYFANGIAISPEEDYLLVNETSTYRVVRYWLKGKNIGKSDLFIENLPGFPDGITLGSNGIFWLTLASPRDKSLDMLMPYPRIRKMIANLPESVQPKPKKYGMVIGINTEGDIISSLHDPDGAFTPITSAEEYNGKLYLGNLTENVFAYYPLGE